MAAQSDIKAIGATRIPIGLSQVLRIMPSGCQYAETMKILSGGGTLELVGSQFSGSSTQAGNAWGTGYPLGLNEIYNVGGPAVFYLCATGATMILAMTLGYTDGATIL